MRARSEARLHLEGVLDTDRRRLSTMTRELGERMESERGKPAPFIGEKGVARVIGEFSYLNSITDKSFNAKADFKARGRLAPPPSSHHSLL